MCTDTRGKFNGIENAVVLFSYPEKAFGNSKELRAFISTNVALSTQSISTSFNVQSRAMILNHL